VTYKEKQAIMGFKSEEIEKIVKEFKGKGKIFAFGLKYLTHKKFIVNKQFDNKNFSVVSKADNMLGEGVLGLFRTKKAAIEFGKRVGMELIDEPEAKTEIPQSQTTLKERVELLLEDYQRRLSTVTNMIANNKNNGSINDNKKAERLSTKQSEYRAFIAELEKTLKG
jgi:hypothetical protein